MSTYSCRPLAVGDDRGTFRCGVEQLDVYLRERAGQDMRRRAAAVFVLVRDDQPQRIAGYYTLSSASIVLEALPDEVARKLPRYPLVPAVLIGRLARDVGFPGVGKLLLLDALKRALRHSEQVAAAVVLVDAKDDAARRFYARYGFRQIPQSPHRMFLAMKTVEQLMRGESSR
jgi:hypothetical protein